MSSVNISFILQVENDSEVKSKFESVSASVESLGEKTGDMAENTAALKSSFTDAATGLTEAANGAFSLYNQFDGLEKIELRVQQAEKNVYSARASLIQSQASLEKLVAKGVTAGSQYEAAQLKVKAAEEQLQLAQDKVALSQGDLSQAQLDFALGVAPAVMDVATNLSTAMGGVKGTMAALTATTNVQRTVNLGSIGSFTTLSSATLAHALATKAATVATKLLHLAMGPIGIAILGVSTFMGLFATNAFGIRDAINAAGKAIGDAIPVLRPLLDMLGGLASAIFPQAEEKAQDFSGTASDSLSQVAQQYPEMAQASQSSAESIAADYDSMAQNSQEMQQMTTASLGLMTENVGTSITAQKGAFADLGHAATEAGNEVVKSFAGAAVSAEQAADRMIKAAKRAASALKSLGVSKSSTSAPDVKAAATGFSGIVSQPTIFLAGEAGPETVNIAPIAAGSGGSSPIVITVVTQLDGREVARSVTRHQAQAM